MDETCGPNPENPPFVPLSNPRARGVNVGLRVMGSADDVEARTGRSALRARAFSRSLG